MVIKNNTKIKSNKEYLKYSKKQKKEIFLKRLKPLFNKKHFFIIGFGFDKLNKSEKIISQLYCEKLTIPQIYATFESIISQSFKFKEQGEEDA